MPEYVFNVASNDGCNGGLRAATALVITLVETLAELDTRLAGPARAFKLPREPWELPVTRDADGQPVSLGQVINSFYEVGETRELAAFFDALQCHAPAVDQLDDGAIDAILRLSPSGPAAEHEAVFDAVCEAGCEAMQCVVTGGVLISLARERWDFDHAVVECGGKRVELDHASRPPHVDGIIQRKLKAGRRAITRQNFEGVRLSAFPSLVWGQDVVGQLAIFPSEYIGLAFKRLAGLDDMAQRWKKSGAAQPEHDGIELQSESELTMQNYGNDRRFRSATGEMKTYETHVRIDRGNRIHLLLDKTNRTVEIGYIGSHLPTWNF